MEIEAIKSHINCCLIREILELAKQRINAGYGDVFLFDRDEKEFYSLFESGLEQKLDKQEVLETVVYKREPIMPKTILVHPICSEIGCIGILAFENTENMLEKLYYTSAEVSYINDYSYLIGRVIINNVIGAINDKVLSSSKTNSLLPYGNHNCVSLFINLRNLSVLLNNKDKKVQMQMQHYLDDFFSLLQEVSYKHFGIINKYLGGGALILFNIMIYEGMEQAGLRAICSALTIIEEYKEIKDFYYDIADNVELELGIGIDGGDAFFTMRSGNDCYDYTCIGKNINISKKIEEFAGRDTIGHNYTETKYRYALGYCSLLLTKEFCKMYKTYRNFSMKEIGRFHLYLDCENDICTVVQMKEEDCHLMPKCIECKGNRSICRSNSEGRYIMKVEE